MYINKNTKVLISACAFLFLMAGVFHYMDLHEDNLPFRFSSISYLAYLTIDILCIFYCRKNIAQPASVRFVVMGVVLLMFWEVITMCEQMLFPAGHVANRTLLYHYYIPITFVPNALLLAVLNFNLHPKQSTNKAWFLTLVVSGVFTLFVLTNDYHQKVFGFHRGFETFYRDYTYEPLFYVIIGWMFFLFILSFIVMVYRASRDRKQKFSWAPIISIILAIIYFAWFMTGSLIIPWFRDFYGVPEVFHGILIASMGLCVSLGLLKANFNFAEFFEASDISATLVDMNGATKYKTAVTIPVSEEQKEAAKAADIYIDEKHRLQSNEINAGRIFWVNDMSSITKVNKELREVKTRLEQDNELLRAENEMVARKVKADEQNRLYAVMTRSIEPQLKSIENLIKDAVPGTPEFRTKITEASVYNAYVKRYCNLIILSQESRVLSSSELEYSFNESLSYMELYGTPCRIETYGEANFNADILIFAYKVFQALIEENKGNIKQFLIEMSVVQGAKNTKSLEVRFYLASKNRVPRGFDDVSLSAYSREANSRGGKITTVRKGSMLLSQVELPESFGEVVHL